VARPEPLLQLGDAVQRPLGAAFVAAVLASRMNLSTRLAGRLAEV
jgi:hypothetical protein